MKSALSFCWWLEVGGGEGKGLNLKCWNFCLLIFCIQEFGGGRNRSPIAATAFGLSKVFLDSPNWPKFKSMREEIIHNKPIGKMVAGEPKVQ